MNNLENYENFLDFIMPVINRKFEHQKEYLSCSKGCALCCKNVNMPFSQLEFEYLMEGFNNLDNNQKQLVLQKIKSQLENSENPECPFLQNEICSVYKYRGIICRTFGLLLVNGDNEYTVPFCVHKGLNYSEIFDEETQQLSAEKREALGYKNDPMFHSLSRQQLFSLQITKDLGLEPGESKPLIEWLKEFYNNYTNKS